MFKALLRTFFLFSIGILHAKTIVVTGGAGLIGSNLCESLLDEGHRVICIDNLSSGSRKNIEAFQKNHFFKFIQLDICEPIQITMPIEEIYHLACPASPIHYQKEPLQTLKTSFIGTLNVLELAREHGAKVVFSSTSEVYGDPLEHPQRESYWGNVNPIGIRACYDEGKRVAESLITSYRKEHGVDCKIVRIFNTYGPRMCENDGRVISNFIIQALENSPITIYGDGSQTRSFCYVLDTILGLKKVMARSSDFVGPVNIGNPSEMTILEVAQKIIKAVGSRSDINHFSLPQDDPKRRKPDISQAHRELGWLPVVSFDDGIKETIAYFQKTKAE